MAVGEVMGELEAMLTLPVVFSTSSTVKTVVTLIQLKTDTQAATLKEVIKLTILVVV